MRICPESDAARYDRLIAIKYNSVLGTSMTLEQEQFLQAYAKAKLERVMQDPEVRAYVNRTYTQADSSWAAHPDRSGGQFTIEEINRNTWI